jgi:nucleoside-diphosphate-sugar epimerase
MRMDLIINAMFKSAMTERKIIVNNPDIWRPIYDIRDCVRAYLLSLKAPLELSGIFNAAAGNFTVLQVAQEVQKALEAFGEKDITLDVKHLPDKRNYKVSTEKIRKHLGFYPKYSLGDIVAEIYRHKEELGDLNQDGYYNIRIFKEMAQKEEAHRQKMAQIDKFKY